MRDMWPFIAAFVCGAIGVGLSHLYDLIPRKPKLSALLREVCAACGSIDANLLAIEGKPGVGKETLLIQSQCKVCGARQFFAPLVVPEDGELKSFQRVGKVEGEAL